MSRPRRLATRGLLLHVIARCNQVMRAFESDDDYLAFLALLRKYKERYRLKLYSYVLLPSHVHLLLSSEIDGGVPRAMRDILTNYTKRYNRHRGRRGSVWEARYGSVVVEEGGQALSCMLYLDTHPLQARLSRKLGQYRWSSYSYYAHAAGDSVVDMYAGYAGLASDEEARRREYQEHARVTGASVRKGGENPLLGSTIFASMEVPRTCFAG